MPSMQDSEENGASAWSTIRALFQPQPQLKATLQRHVGECQAFCRLSKKGGAEQEGWEAGQCLAEHSFFPMLPMHLMCFCMAGVRPTVDGLS